MGELEQKGKWAKEASYQLGIMTADEKNQALLAMADGLEAHCAAILAANQEDMQAAQAKGLPQAFLDRLLLNEARVADMAQRDG